MKDIVFIIPVFNDWGTLKKLIRKIDLNIKDFRGNHILFLEITKSTSHPWDFLHGVSFAIE